MMMVCVLGLGEVDGVMQECARSNASTARNLEIVRRLHLYRGRVRIRCHNFIRNKDSFIHLTSYKKGITMIKKKI